MEKSDNIYVVKSKFEWSDLGSWNIIHEISPKNNQGNSIIGDGMIIEGKNNFLQSRKTGLLSISPRLTIREPKSLE